MQKVFDLIAALGDGSARSGAALAKELGISRGAVWNRVRRIRETGLEVFAVPGSGYRLPGGFEFLDAERIADSLSAADAAAARVDVLQVTDSTNQRLLDRDAAGGIHRHLCLAEYQTAGRGRRGNQWVAPPGATLCLSYGWRFDNGPAALSALSLVVGIALRRALLPWAGDATLKVKWPNDIYRNDAKLAGILIEMRSEFGGPCTVVIGIGVNLALGAPARRLIDQPAAGLASAGVAISRNAVAIAIATELVRALEPFAVHGFAPLAGEWKASDYLAGRTIELDLPDGCVRGRAAGVDPEGRLVLEIDGGTRTFMAGHVRLVD